MGEAVAKQVVVQETSIPYEVTDHFGGEDGAKSFKVIKADGISISLFPASAQAKPDAKVRLIYNAQVDFPALEIGFRMTIKEMVESGDLLAGSSAKLGHRRAVVTEYNNGKNYERMTIGNNSYKKIMALIAAVHKSA